MTAEPSTQPLPILKYASPRSAEVKGELDAIVHQLISAGAGPRGIRRYFRSDRDAMNYFRQVMQEHYHADWLSHECIHCGKPAPGLAVQVEWRLRMRPRFLEFVASQGARRMPMLTTHSICPACAESWRRNLRWQGALRLLLILTELFIWLNLLGLCAQIMHRSGSEWKVLIALIAFFVLLFSSDSYAGALTGWVMCRRRPPALGKLMPPEVGFHRLGRFVNPSAGGGSSGIKD